MGSYSRGSVLGDGGNPGDRIIWVSLRLWVSSPRIAILDPIALVGYSRSRTRLIVCSIFKYYVCPSQPRRVHSIRMEHLRSFALESKLTSSQTSKRVRGDALLHTSNLAAWGEFTNSAPRCISRLWWSSIKDLLPHNTCTRNNQTIFARRHW